MKASILILFFILFGSLSAQQLQKFLAIDPVHGTKRQRIYIGDFINLKTKDQRKISNTILKLKDSAIFLAGDTVHLNEISKVYFSDLHYGWSLLSKIGLRAGLGYFIIDTGNRYLNKDDPRVSKTTVNVSLGFLGVGIVSHFLNRKVIRIKKSYQLKIIDLSLSTP